MSYFLKIRILIVENKENGLMCIKKLGKSKIYFFPFFLWLHGSWYDCLELTLSTQKSLLENIHQVPDISKIVSTFRTPNYFHDRCPLGSGGHRVKNLACLIDLPTFSKSLSRVTGDIVGEVDELKKVKTLLKAIPELGWVMPHSGFGTTLNPTHLNKFAPLKKKFLPTIFF